MILLYGELRTHVAEAPSRVESGRWRALWMRHCAPNKVEGAWPRSTFFCALENFRLQYLAMPGIEIYLGCDITGELLP